MLEITSSNKINNSNRTSSTGILTKLFLIFLLSYFFTTQISFAYNNLPACNGSNQHRKSCYDVIDLPLCSDAKSPSPASPSNQNGNCVKECKDMNASDISSQPNEGHNYSCIRFCDSVNTNSPKCIARACHQLPSGQSPTSDNCTVLDCHLLSNDELNTIKFNDDSKKYCNGDNIKCYEFGKAKLPYVKFRSINSMCKIHNCKPDSDSCGADETKNITNRCDSPYKEKFLGTNACQSGESSKNYSDDYLKYINANMSIDSGVCQPVTCKPIVNRQYRCTPEDDSNPTVKNSLCTTSCSNGFCSKIIDCNISSNSKETECLAGEPQTIDTMVDTTNAWFYRPKPSDDLPLNDKGLMDKNINKQDLCYTTGQMEDNDWGTDTFILGWWHGFVARSPGHCSAWKSGLRGLGYANLCGTGGNVYNKPDEDAAYIAGYATANYDLDDPEYGIRTCLRFKNSGALNACGARECRIDCGFSFCGLQWCGSDICVNLTLNESNVDKCSLKKNSDLFEDSSGDSSCIETVDNGWGSGFGIGRMRLRAKKYGRRMCVFLDMAGTFAYDAQYLDGTETLDDGATCIEGQNGDDGKCEGFDTNKDKGLAHRWRTIKIPNSTVVSYVAQPGYYDLNGQFFSPQQCAMVPLRIGPPKYYNIATPSNSATLFAPPVYILSAKVKRGREISPAEPGEQYGVTDFFEPEIEIKFGGEVINTNGMQEPVNYESTPKKSSQLLSLGAGESDYNDKDDNASPSYAILQTKMFGVKYVAEVFVKKSYDENKKTGLLCLYRRFTSGKDSTEIQIGCVKRKTPEIFGTVSGIVEKARITSGINNRYDSSEIALQMSNQGPNNKDDNCQSDDICSVKIDLEQEKLDKEKCSYDIEKYKFCVKREECTKLYMECVTNEINLHNAKLLNQPTGNLENIKLECNTTILNNCNKKWGIISTKARDIFEQVLPDPKTTNYYGWYNEICITTGFNTKLRKVLSYKIDDGLSVMGKCIIDIPETMRRNPSFNANDITTQCAGGGRAPKCICQESTNNTPISDNQIERLETPREAGLCIDIPKPVACLAIDWTDNIYTPKSESDLYHVTDSIDKNSYGTNLVDYSHLFRTEKEIFNPSNKLGTYDASKTKSHAEFDLAIMGMTNVEGTCNGFWKPIANSSGVALKPKMDCLEPSDPSSTIGKWDYANIKSECIRYQCPVVSTSGIQSSGEYQNGYGSNEAGEQKGTYHGFALWPSYSKGSRNDGRGDFLESVTATECIVGFKARGGSLPIRDCNQLGSWGTPTNVCERIYCPAINMMSNGTTPINTMPTSQQEWKKWEDYGGASFPSVAASRDKYSIRPESLSIGTCNNNIGAFQTPGGDPPKIECDYQGNWGPVKNRCVSTCDAINDSQGRTNNNGFAMWPETKVVIGDVSKPGTFLGCVSGYIVNPYKPLPTKECLSTITAFGVRANIWAVTQNGCIDGCQGYAEDPTEGIGLTTLPSSKGNVQIKWSKTTLGGDAYYQSPDSGCSILDASKFQPGRTNGCYRLKRHCNIDGRWDQPTPMCMANNGKIGFATYPGSNGFIVNSGTTTSGSCIDGYKANGSSNPIRECTYKSGNTNIDEVSFSFSSGTSDCIEVTCTATAPTTKTGTTPKVCFFGSCFGGDTYTYQEPTIKSPDGTSVYNGANKTVKIGEKVYLSCNGNYGYKIIGGSRSSSDTNNTCGLSSTDRDTSSPPYASCKSDGTFEFGNSCQKCRDCNSSSSVPSNRVHADKACVTETWSMPHVMDGNNCNKNASHGDQKNFGVYYEDYCAGNCEDGNKGICMVGTLQCLDGKYTFIKDVSHQDGCSGSDNSCWECYDDDDCGDW